MDKQGKRLEKLEDRKISYLNKLLSEGNYMRIDVYKTQLNLEDLKDKLKYAFFIHSTSHSHVSYYIHKEDYKAFDGEITTFMVSGLHG